MSLSVGTPHSSSAANVSREVFEVSNSKAAILSGMDESTVSAARARMDSAIA